jgi:hypothetical protein
MEENAQMKYTTIKLYAQDVNDSQWQFEVPRAER